MASPAPKLWSEATAIKQSSPHTYEAQFPGDWCIGTVPHGGFVTGTFLQVVRTHFNTTLSSQNQPHTITLHLDFLRRTQEGPALFTVKDVKLGRQTSVIHVSLSQQGRDEVVGYITNSNMHTETGVTFSTNWKLTPPSAPVDLALLKEDKDGNWARQGEMPFSSFRKATTKTQFHFPRAGQTKKSEADEWIRLNTGEKWTNTSLGYVADMWPMPIEAFLRDSNPYNVNKKGGSKNTAVARFWYPTVLLNIDFKKPLPEEGVDWLFVRAAAKQIKKGRMDIDIVILDEGGEIVALSQHVALAVPTERNVAKRKNGSKI